MNYKRLTPLGKELLQQLKTEGYLDIEILRATYSVSSLRSAFDSLRQLKKAWILKGHLVLPVAHQNLFCKQRKTHEYVSDALKEHGALTTLQLSDITGCSHAAVRRACEIMRADGQMHISGYEWGTRKFSMQLTLGAGENASMPVTVPAPRKSRAAPKKPENQAPKRIRPSRRKPAITAPQTTVRTRFVGASPWAGL